jgi:hypothetical protein|tara:strand:- start:556 stop:804 length:249 start_codon:yes stop_codon:yes gene_type:complete
MSLKLIKETLLIGLAFGVLGLVISTAFMFLPNKDGKKFDLKDYHFWWQVFLSNAVTGALLHLLCEVTGVNKWYCKNGNACSK